MTEAERYSKGLSVLDLPNLTPRPFASQALADFGATVRPGAGDLERSRVPAYLRACNRGKASIAIDLRNHVGIAEPTRPPGVGSFQMRDGRYVTDTAVEDHIFVNLAGAIGRPDLADSAENAPYASRSAYAATSSAAIAETIRQLGAEECRARMREHGGCSAPVTTPIEALDDPQVQALGIIHSDSSPHVDIPIFAAARVRRLRLPEQDEDGDHVRSFGWQGSEKRLEGR